MKMPSLPSAPREILTDVVAELRAKLGENLYSCILYGSAVRGSFVVGSSNLNLLIILNYSTPAAHREIAGILQRNVGIEPFIISRIGMERSFEAFAIKFCSIKRNYQLLYGEDPLRDLIIDEKILRFLIEQALRNLRLRGVRAYIRLGQERQQYIRYLVRIVPQTFTNISAALRVKGIPVEGVFASRIPLFTEHLGGHAQVLKDLLALKEQKIALSDEELFQVHSKLFTLLDKTIAWLSE
jgi:predicted nucleotidyltransferase